MTKSKVVDAGDLRKYRIEIPNIIDSLELDPHTVRLYVHLKRVAGPGGACWQSTKIIANHCKMSTGQVSKSKQILKDNELITITEVKHEKPGSPYHLITIVDIWLRNFQKFSQGSQGERQGSQGETKKELIKKELGERENKDIELFESFERHPESAFREENPEAIAVPTKKSSAIEEVARQLALSIDWVWGSSEPSDKKLLHAAEELLKQCGGDVDGTLDALDAYLDNPKNRKWAKEEAQDPHWLLKSVSGQYQKLRGQARHQATAHNDWAEHAERSQAYLEARPAKTPEEIHWEGALAELEMQMTANTFAHLFGGTQLVNVTKFAAVVEVYSESAKEMLEFRWAERVAQALGVESVEFVI